MKDPDPLRAAARSWTEPRSRATAKITVQDAETRPYDQTTRPALVEIRLFETFTGEMEGESPVRALQVLGQDGTASLVSLQRFQGKLGRRHGTFVLQGAETVEQVQDQGAVVRRARIGHRRARPAAGRGRLRGGLRQRLRGMAGVLVRVRAAPGRFFFPLSRALKRERVGAHREAMGRVRVCQAPDLSDPHPAAASRRRLPLPLQSVGEGK